MHRQSEAKEARDHAWRYFELHAGQRMSLFNFYLVLSGLVIAGMAGIYVNKFAPLAGAAVSVTLVVVALVFWKLDQRVSFLMKRAEIALADLEASFPSSARLFHMEPEHTKLARQSDWVWTYGRSFRLVFSITAGIGLLSTIFWSYEFIK